MGSGLASQLGAGCGDHVTQNEAIQESGGHRNLYDHNVLFNLNRETCGQWGLLECLEDIAVYSCQYTAGSGVQDVHARSHTCQEQEHLFVQASTGTDNDTHTHTHTHTQASEPSHVQR